MLDKKARFMHMVRDAPENYLRLMSERNDSLAVLFDVEDDSLLVYKWSDKGRSWSMVAAGGAPSDWATSFRSVNDGSSELSEVMKGYIDFAVEEGTAMCSTMETIMAFIATTVSSAEMKPRLMFNQRALEEDEEE